jgi:uncharacterized protein (DUF1778 family)
MAAPLTDEGRHPALQTLTRAEYDHFVKACAEPAKPSETLMALLAAYKRARWSPCVQTSM